MSMCPHCGIPVGADFAFCVSCGKPVSGDQATAPPPSPQVVARSSGRPWLFVAVSMAIVGIAFVGIIAAVAVPNFLNAVQRGKQKRTMADMRSLEKAMSTFEVDNNRYPADLSELQPKYLKTPPMLDGWGNPWVTTFGYQEYTIVSLGKNGDPDGEAYYGGTTSTFNSDVVYSNGLFIQYPDGRQTNN